MKIRTRLSLQFLGIVTTLVTISLLLIYFFSAEYRSKDFFTRLRNKTITTAKLIAEIKSLDSNFLKIIDRNETSIISDKNVLIFDENYHELYNYNPHSEIPISNQVLEKIKKVGEVHFSEENYQMFGKIFPNKQGSFIIVTSGVDILGFDKLLNFKFILVAVFFSSIILVSFAGYMFSGRALAPISEIIKEVDNISAKNLGQRLNEGNGKDEIASLSKTFNNMLGRIEGAFNMQKDFVANASHELRTPLTAISGQIEVTLLKDRPVDEYKNVLNSIFDDIKNLSTLSNRLLSLAQVSSEKQDFNFNNIRVDEILFKSREELLLGNKDYNITIEFAADTYDENQLKVNGNDTLLKIAFSNIMDNGCKFSNDGKVLVKMSFNEKEVNVDFIDHGIWIRPEEHKHIFEPFAIAW